MGTKIINELEFEAIMEKLYPDVRSSNNKARFYFNEKQIEMKLPEEYNQEQILKNDLSKTVS